MLSRALLKEFLTYLKSQVGHYWRVEVRKSKGGFKSLEGFCWSVECSQYIVVFYNPCTYQRCLDEELSLF